jgi:hypothetical protein
MAPPKTLSTQLLLKWPLNTVHFLLVTILRVDKPALRQSWVISWSVLVYVSPPLFPTTTWVTMTEKIFQKTNASSQRRSLREVFWMMLSREILSFIPLVKTRLITKLLSNTFHLSEIQNALWTNTRHKFSLTELILSVRTTFVRIPF